MKRMIGKLASLTALLLVMNIQPAHAVLELDINQGTPNPLPIAIPNFAAASGDLASVGAQMTGVIAADLERSGLFRIIDQGAYIEQIGYQTVTPRYADWRQISADGLVVGKIDAAGPGKMKVSFRLFDNLAEVQMAGRQFDATSTNWRRIAHLVADEIYKRITGEDGYFDTRIVYIAESGPGTRRIKRLAIMDQDGENHKFLTNGRSLVLTPRFSPNTQEILYLSYAGGAPRVYLRDLQTGREESLGRFDGMSFAPRFNHDGNKMVMSIAKSGVTNIYEMDLRSRQMRKLTNAPAIDTSPSYSPDGSQIVFNSDRGGSQQIYVMPAGGGAAKRISFGNGNYSTPVWSPRGDLIAFTKQAGGQFSIGLMRTDGSGERLITQSWLDEGPTWAPNGRVIMFSRQAGGGARRSLYSIDITGNNLRRVVTPIEASDPAWSPLLPL
jgi:TolB protein